MLELVTLIHLKGLFLSSELKTCTEFKLWKIPRTINKKRKLREKNNTENSNVLSIIYPCMVYKDKINYGPNNYGHVELFSECLPAIIISRLPYIECGYFDFGIDVCMVQGQIMVPTKCWVLHLNIFK